MISENTEQLFSSLKFAWYSMRNLLKICTVLLCFLIYNYLNYYNYSSFLISLFYAPLMCVYMCVYVYVYMYIYVCMYVCIYIYIYICMHIYIYIYIYIHTNITNIFSFKERELKRLIEIWLVILIINFNKECLLYYRFLNGNAFQWFHVHNCGIKNNCLEEPFFSLSCYN